MTNRIASRADRYSVTTGIAVGMISSQPTDLSQRLIAIPATAIMPSSKVKLPACGPGFALPGVMVSSEKIPGWGPNLYYKRVNDGRSPTCCFFAT